MTTSEDSLIVIDNPEVENRFLQPRTTHLEAPSACKRVLNSTLLSPPQHNASKLYVRSHSQVGRGLLLTNSPRPTPTEPLYGLPFSPERRFVTRESLSPGFKLHSSLGLSDVHDSYQSLPVEDSEPFEGTQFAPLSFSQLASTFPSSSLYQLKKHARRQVRSETVDGSSQIDNLTQIATVVPDLSFDDVCVETRGSPDHSLRGLRMPPPSLRKREKPRKVSRVQSLNFDMEVGNCSHSASLAQQQSIATPHSTEENPKWLGRTRSHMRATNQSRTEQIGTASNHQPLNSTASGLVTHDPSVVTATPTTSSKYQQVLVNIDAFEPEQLSLEDRKDEKILCDLLEEYPDLISGCAKVLIRTVDSRTFLETFKQNLSFNIDVVIPLIEASNSPEMQVQRLGYDSCRTPLEVTSSDLSPSTTDRASREAKEDSDGPSSTHLDSDWDEAASDSCDTVDFLSNASDSDWEDYAREIVEEDLPRIGVHSKDDEAEWETDPFEWRYSDENWNSNNTEFSHDTTFHGRESIPRPNLYGAQTPIGIFEQILDEASLRMIITETNRYARCHPCKAAWSDLTRPELRAWLGVAIFMGILKTPSRRDHWSTDEALFKHRLISSIMSRDRYESILRNLHLVDNSTLNLARDDPAFDKICKVRPFLDRISANSRSLKDVDEHVTVDEMMILGGGRLCPIMQHNPNKPVKHGIKILAACSSHNRYVYYYSVYCGKENNQSKSVLDQTVAMLWFIPRHRNYRVTMDNWFSSVKLFETLRKDGILCLGTCRTNRVGWPTFMSHRDQHAVRGDMIWSMHRSRSIAAVMWMDHTHVPLLSTCVRPELVDAPVTVRRWEKRFKHYADVPTSPMVLFYQRWMRGVDVHDQLREAYSLRQKTRKWWHRLFWFAIDTACTNAWILWRLHQKAEGLHYGSHLKFLLKLGHSLTSGYRTGRTASQALGCYMAPYAHRGPIHFTSRSSHRRQCVECAKRTTMICPRCESASMCAGPCFVKHHSRKNCCKRRS